MEGGETFSSLIYSHLCHFHLKIKDGLLFLARVFSGTIDISIISRLDLSPLGRAEKF